MTINRTSPFFCKIMILPSRCKGADTDALLPEAKGLKSRGSWSARHGSCLLTSDVREGPNLEHTRPHPVPSTCQCTNPKRTPFHSTADDRSIVSSHLNYHTRTFPAVVKHHTQERTMARRSTRLSSRNSATPQVRGNAYSRRSRMIADQFIAY